MKLEFGFFSFLFVSIMGTAGASNILGMFLTYSPSHVIVHMGAVRALVERGHNVTVITSTPLNDPNPGYRHIFLKQLEFTQNDMDTMVKSLKDSPMQLLVINSFRLIRSLVERYADFVADPAFISFLAEGNQFDLMLLGYTFNEFQLGVAAHFKCPVVLSWMIQPTGHVSRLIGNPTLPAFVPPAPFMHPSPMSFSRRVLSFIISIVERSLSEGFQFYLDSLYTKNYPSGKYPSLAEVKKNISLVLSNHHFSEGPVRALVPGLIEVGGIQIKDKPDPLPEDIEEFLKNSPQGAVLFSLGSYVRVDHLGPNAMAIIYNVLSSLPYNVIWKCDRNQLPDNYRAANILFRQWLPQDDLLAHENLKLFITHGGKGSITESEYHGVPMVAIPIMGDQPSNANAMQMKGHGVLLAHQTMTEDSFRKSILDVMKNKIYRNKVQRFSKLYRDRPLTARENAVFWIEYVIRHKGAPHMQSPLRTLNILQENSIDVILFLLLLLYGIVKIVKILLGLSQVLLKQICDISKQKDKEE